MLERYGVTEANWRDGARVNPHFAAISESPRFVGRAVAALAADPDVQRHNGGSFSSGGLAREYGFTDVDGSRPDCWRYLVEVQDAGHAGRPDRLPLSQVSAPRQLQPDGLRAQQRDVAAGPQRPRHREHRGLSPPLSFVRASGWPVQSSPSNTAMVAGALALPRRVTRTRPPLGAGRSTVWQPRARATRAVLALAVALEPAPGADGYV